MAGLASALALVPWGTLIDKAPQIAASAAELVAKARPAAPPAPLPPDPLIEMSARLSAAEARVEEASRLIAGLADSNAALVAAAGRARRMLHVALGLSAASLLAAAGAWIA